MNLLQSAALILAIAFSLPAQDCSYSQSPDVLATGRFGAGLFPAGSQPGPYYRRQVRVPAEAFGNVPRFVTEIYLGVTAGSRTLRFESLNIRVGQTTVTSLSTEFDRNITGPMETVLEAEDLVRSYGRGPAWVALGIQDSFWVFPGRGDVLIDILQFGAQELERRGDWVGVSATSGTPGGGIVTNSGSTPPTSGAVEGFSINLRFCTDSDALDSFGEGCSGSLPWPLVNGLSGDASIGGRVSVWTSNMPSGATGGLLLGLDVSPPFPTDLSAVGMPGCRLYFSPMDSLPIRPNAVGVGQEVLTIPPVARFVGARLYVQSFSLDPGGNAAGVITSNYSRVLIGL